jgi:hypothetical protein
MGVEVVLHHSLRLSMMQMSDQLHASAGLSREISLGSPWIGGPRVGLDATENKRIEPWLSST